MACTHKNSERETEPLALATAIDDFKAMGMPPAQVQRLSKIKEQKTWDSQSGRTNGWGPSNARRIGTILAKENRKQRAVAEDAWLYITDPFHGKPGPIKLDKAFILAEELWLKYTDRKAGYDPLVVTARPRRVLYDVEHAGLDKIMPDEEVFHQNARFETGNEKVCLVQVEDGREAKVVVMRAPVTFRGMQVLYGQSGPRLVPAEGAEAVVKGTKRKRGEGDEGEEGGDKPAPKKRGRKVKSEEVGEGKEEEQPVRRSQRARKVKSEDVQEVQEVQEAQETQRVEEVEEVEEVQEVQEVPKKSIKPSKPSKPTKGKKPGPKAKGKKPGTKAKE